MTDGDLDTHGDLRACANTENSRTLDFDSHGFETD